MARMRGKDIAMTRGWLISRLAEHIAACRARIATLRTALEEVGR
ncbi:MAG TPA: hypothetical protein VNO34_10595 [Actinomycetota bacterium]|nr:hypothetical protein [Actinomycetota bacterium]